MAAVRRRAVDSARNRAALPLADEVLISANEPARFEALLASLPLPARVVPDLYPGAGPLAGLHAGLSAMTGELLLALGGDMPFVNLPLVAHMLELADGFDAVVPELPLAETGDLAREPLHAIYQRSCLPAVTARLGHGDRRMISFMADVKLPRADAGGDLPARPGLSVILQRQHPGGVGDRPALVG